MSAGDMSDGLCRPVDSRLVSNVPKSSSNDIGLTTTSRRNRPGIERQMMPGVWRGVLLLKLDDGAIGASA